MSSILFPKREYICVVKLILGENNIDLKTKIKGNHPLRRKKKEIFLEKNLG